MKINKILSQNIEINKNKKTIQKHEEPSKEKKTPAAYFEKSKAEDETHVYDKFTIQRLKAESAKSFDSFKKMIESSLSRQGKLVDIIGLEDIEIDQATRKEASELISEDGPLGVENLSDSIVDFAIAISGGNKDKLDTLIQAINKGFEQARKQLGGLPDISLKTYDRIMEKLDIWKNEE